MKDFELIQSNEEQVLRSATCDQKQLVKITDLLVGTTKQLEDTTKVLVDTTAQLRETHQLQEMIFIGPLYVYLQI